MEFLNLGSAGRALHERELDRRKSAFQADNEEAAVNNHSDSLGWMSFDAGVVCADLLGDLACQGSAGLFP